MVMEGQASVRLDERELIPIFLGTWSSLETSHIDFRDCADR